MIVTQYRVQLVAHDARGRDHIRQSALAADLDGAGALRTAFEHLGSTLAGRTDVRVLPVQFDVPDWETAR
jgi:hypothetical protein